MSSFASWGRARPLKRETVGLRGERKPLQGLALKRERRRVSAPAPIVNLWVGQFRNGPSTRGNPTLFKRPRGAQQRLFSMLGSVQRTQLLHFHPMQAIDSSDTQTSDYRPTRPSNLRIQVARGRAGIVYLRIRPVDVERRFIRDHLGMFCSKPPEIPLPTRERYEEAASAFTARACAKHQLSCMPTSRGCRAGLSV